MNSYSTSMLRHHNNNNNNENKNPVETGTLFVYLFLRRGVRLA